MNRVMIIGNLTADPETRTTQSGSTVCNFTVAVNRRKTQSEPNPEADFFRVSAWNKLADPCQRFLAKGKKVFVCGPVSVSMYNAQDGTTRASMNIMASDVEFLSPANGENGGGAGAPAMAGAVPANGENGGGAGAPAMAGAVPVNVNDELPF